MGSAQPPSGPRRQGTRTRSTRPIWCSWEWGWRDQQRRGWQQTRALVTSDASPGQRACVAWRRDVWDARQIGARIFRQGADEAEEEEGDASPRAQVRPSLSFWRERRFFQAKFFFLPVPGSPTQSPDMALLLLFAAPCLTALASRLEPPRPRRDALPLPELARVPLLRRVRSPRRELRFISKRRLRWRPCRA